MGCLELTRPIGGLRTTQLGQWVLLKKKVGPVGSGASLDLYAGTMLMFLKKSTMLMLSAEGKKALCDSSTQL